MKTSDAFDKPYDPTEIEARRAEYWVKNEFFCSAFPPRGRESGGGEHVPAALEKQPYTIVIPPPNVTGDLHIGHVLNNTLQDVLIRSQRLMGKDACWIPGTDHASIATEAKVTKMLAEQGVSKRAIGREAFLKEAYAWKDKYGGRIVSALKRLGASCDWSKEVFTMDEKYSRAVLSAFVSLYKRGYVYKGQRLVNWCPVSQSVISDEEVINEERQGNLWHIAYPVVGAGSEAKLAPGAKLVVATTRPETLFGDLAVAVHPEDERYKDFIGQRVRIPVSGRLIPVIADTYVEKDFGTGVLKITPAHDMNDYEVGKRHNLGLLNIMNPDASLNENVPEAYVGLDRYVARKKIVAELKELGLLEKTVNHKMVIGISERGNVPIEYYLSSQWYFKMKDLAALALECTRSGELNLYPKFTEKIWEHWLGNIQDWCVSRQLWWGHRIPVYTCKACDHVHCQVDKPKSCASCGKDDSHLVQDEDVLDTWASSWLWPFAVHGWEADSGYQNRAANALFDRYYPTEVIVTGQDIIFFWIARMAMAGRFFTGKTPFKAVFFTPIVRDEKGRKMSKSLGNSPDIAEVMEKYGTDALRFSLVHQIVPGQDIHWKNESCEMGRNFCNKMWNATRFLLGHCESLGVNPQLCTFENLQLPRDDIATCDVARWLVSEFNQTVLVAQNSLKNYQFSQYAAKLYEFIWMVYCDWFVELLKPRLQNLQGGAEQGGQGIASAHERDERAATVALLQCGLCLFDGSLRLLHPLMPFVTEEIWQRLAATGNSFAREGRTIGLERWPEASLKNFPTDEEAIAQMRLVQAVVNAVRTIRGQYSLHPGLSLEVNLPPRSQGRFGRHLGQMEFLARAKFRFDEKLPKVIGAALAQGIEVFVNLEGHIDPATEVAKLKERIKKLDAVLAGINAKLSSAKFVEGAPSEIVAGAKEQRSANETEKGLLQRVLAAMGG